MIVSTVNFVNNYKFSDFIIEKITEEQSARDELLQTGVTKRHSFCAPTASKEEVENCSRRRTSLRSKCSGSGDFVKSSTSSTLSQASTATAIDSGHLVTIETADNYVLTADTQSLHVCLKKNSPASPNIGSVFRRIDFQDDLSVFQLHSNPTYFLAATHLRHIVVQSYCEDTLDTDDPDERFFQRFRSDYGVELLQPVAHQGYLIHHIDDFLDLRRLELHLRPPEEFYLSFTTVKPDAIRIPPSAASSCSSAATLNESTADGDATHHLRLAIPDISKNSLKRKDSKKAKEKMKLKNSPITPKQGMLSCFGIGSKRKKKNKR